MSSAAGTTPGRRITTRTRATVLRADGTSTIRRETLAGEQPLEIRVNGQQLAVTMRTPGNDFFLVAGNLVAEGFLTRAEQIDSLRYCSNNPGPDGDRSYNVVDATIPSLDSCAVDFRRVITTSACGICGSTSIDQVRKTSEFTIDPTGPVIDRDLLLGLPDSLRRHQRLFDSTGGLHAAGLFDGAGRLLAAHEDVGRHNAVDKVIGEMVLADRLPLAGTIMQVSGRASFELVQKCVLAGIPVMAAVSAPSSLAVQLAADAGLTLVGFSRGDRATVYTHTQKIINLTRGDDCPTTDQERI
ncbi:formate dehydrogenase accessory sulfurtransferase FdhD [Corynebacterium mendelii]|uniref:Sulfur carrier protein FdhD n=1 Tax=Corynebacterium mendelii TaxID=2765362 RepID=A0A939E198_9CORY|nr:formate dehydrogenase accessory sulfurtransferase FdhD [Corynebacterium mendelii]MBN9643861.1 formate dehydrogenase accessory sulfurtransferase FdhD [Corynebacterium mendelii]